MLQNREANKRYVKEVLEKRNCENKVLKEVFRKKKFGYEKNGRFGGSLNLFDVSHRRREMVYDGVFSGGCVVGLNSLLLDLRKESLKNDICEKLNKINNSVKLKYFRPWS